MALGLASKRLQDDCWGIHEGPPLPGLGGGQSSNTSSTQRWHHLWVPPPHLPFSHPAVMSAHCGWPHCILNVIKALKCHNNYKQLFFRFSSAAGKYIEITISIQRARERVGETVEHQCSGNHPLWKSGSCSLASSRWSQADKEGQFTKFPHVPRKARSMKFYKKCLSF